MRRDARENRERITQAARAVFAVRGLGATLHDIADHAGVGVGTVYRHFPGKEHVVATVFDDEVDRVVGLAERALQHPQPWEGFTQFYLDVAGELTSDRGLQEVMLAADADAPAGSSAQARLAKSVEAVVARAQESGELRADFSGSDFPMLARMLCAVSNVATDGDRQLWRRYAMLVLDGLSTRSTAPLPLQPGPPVAAGALDSELDE
jgi:AcrR family transcriptional regulator